MTVRCRSVDRFADFQALAPAWDEVAAQGGQHSPFLSHDWFTCCWMAQPSSHEPEVLVVEDGGEPAGLIPLARWTERRRRVPVRCLGFLQGPDTAFCDLLSAGNPAVAARALVDHLAGRRDWDVARLDKIPTSAPALKALEETLAGRLLSRRTGTLASPYLAIAGDWETFYRGKSQRFRKTCRNTQNRIERAGRVSVEEHRALDPEGPVYAEVIDLTRRSWKAPRGVAIGTMPGMLGFFAELTRRAGRRGWLSVWTLRLDGRVVAMEYQLRAGGRVHALRADFDLAHAELSPGSALNQAMVQSLFERGDVREYDMGPGLNEYKLRWATGSHDTVDVEVYGRSPRGRLLWALETVAVPAARRTREWLR